MSKIITFFWVSLGGRRIHWRSRAGTPETDITLMNFFNIFFFTENHEELDINHKCKDYLRPKAKPSFSISAPGVCLKYIAFHVVPRTLRNCIEFLKWKEKEEIPMENDVGNGSL